MATGWAKDGAVQDQIDYTIRDAVTRARANLRPQPPSTPAPTTCIECGEEIPERTVSLAIHGQGLGDHSPARACAGLNCPSLILEFFNI